MEALDYRLMLAPLRKKRGLSQKQVADRVGVTPGAVAHWELGTAEPRLENLVALAELLRCTTDALLGRRPPKYSVPEGGRNNHATQ